MSYRNERFNRSMKSLDAMLSGYSDPSKSKVLGDGGKALEQLLDAIDYSPERKREQKRQLADNRLARRKNRLQRLASAIRRTIEANKAHLVPTLLLIVRNGSRRKESLKLIPERTYRRHRHELCKLFGVTP